MAEPLAHPDSFRDQEEPRSSKVVWDALCDAKREFGPYFDYCDRIDRIIDASGNLASGQGAYYSDQEFDLFWSSLEILKPAVYSHPPAPVVTPRFQDRDKVATTTSELLERCLVSTFERSDFDQVMLNVRDDLVVSARGVTRVAYEDDAKGGGKRACSEHVDRCDFLHEPARKWSEVGWVSFAGYLTQREFEKRFKKADASKAQFNIRRDRTDGERTDTSAKCKVWEVWHKADNRVYWVTEGIETFLDESTPFLALEGFFPCPRPAYGVLKRRTLTPIPDYVRYEKTLEQINELTRRIHSLLGWIRVKGLIPSGGDVGNAVETALSQQSDDVILIPIPASALIQGSGQFVQFLPLQEFAATITGLIEARRELIQNFYELSGISDIMRGATEAEETLGAQQLKSQYGSVRVREKIDELQRVARDVARISAEIIAEKFDKDTILSMAQMNIPTRAEIKKQVADIRRDVEKELAELEKQASEAIAEAQKTEQQVDPAKAQAQFEQQQQAIIAKFAPVLKDAREQVAIEDVMELLKDQKARAFSIEIETDSTILTDEMGEKQARAEFLQAFSNASAAVTPLLQAGEAGAKLAGGMLKFAIAPFRAGRQLDALVDDFVDAAPQMAASMAGGEGGEAEQALVEAQNKLAEAEMKKAEAQTLKVQTDAQGKVQDLQLRMAESQAKAQADAQKLQLQVAEAQEKARAAQVKSDADIEALNAKINLMQAQTAEILNKIGLDVRKQDLEEYRAVTDTQLKVTDQSMNAQNAERDAEMAERGEMRADREQVVTEQQGARSEERADRQQDFSERSSDRQMTLAERQAERESAE